MNACEIELGRAYIANVTRQVYPRPVGVVGYGHIQDDKLEDLPDGQVEIIIATPNSHGDDISIEDYQAYHDELRSNGAYQLLGYSLVCGMSLVLIGAVLIRLFRKEV